MPYYQRKKSICQALWKPAINGSRKEQCYVHEYFFRFLGWYGDNYRNGGGNEHNLMVAASKEALGKTTCDIAQANEALTNETLITSLRINQRFINYTSLTNAMLMK